MKSLKILFFLLPALGAPLYAHAVANSDFDHFATGFELDGKHRNVDCEACHVRGIFKGTPRACGACHDGSNFIASTSKPVTHMLTSAVCEGCHTTTNWASVPIVDHAEVFGTCQSCHNGTYASGKPPTHPQTSEDCDACHNTMTWLGAGFDHTGIVDNCVSCHDGTRATGKGPNHIRTNNICEDCHTTIAWEPVITVDHNDVFGACSSCHNGVVATGKPTDHPATIAECSECHSTVAWKPALSDPAAFGGLNNGGFGRH
jgi:hypothetical protein